MKSSTLQRIQDICTAFDHRAQVKKKILQITGIHHISVINREANLYALTYDLAFDTPETIRCNGKHLPYLILEILSRKELGPVTKKDYTLDLQTFLAEEGTSLVTGMIARLAGKSLMIPEITGNRYVLTYHNGWALIADDVFFQETYPLLMKMTTLVAKSKKFSKKNRKIQK